MTRLALRYGTSRARNTMGYPTVRLRDVDTGASFGCMGGGYDLIGTVFADWLEATHQGALRLIADQAYASGSRGIGSGLYGMSVRDDGGVVLYGACGLSAMVRVAEAIGLQVRQHFDDQAGRTTGFEVTPAPRT